MTTRVVRHVWAGSVLAVVGVLACEGDVTTVNDPVGPPSYDMRLISITGPRLPRAAGFEAAALSFVSFDTSVADAFGRKGDLFFTLRTTSVPTIGGPGWDLRSTVRRRAVDGRVPLLSPIGAPDAALFSLQGPEAAGEMWRLNLRLTGLAASTSYRVALVRYRLSRADSLDQAAVLLTGSNFRVPDTLTALGGSASAVVSGGCTSTTAVVPTSTANPLYIGTFTTNAAGASGTVQRCLRDASGLWYRSDQVDSRRTPIAPNSDLTFGLPRYNYIVVETVTGTPVLRAQIGQDLTAAASPINNTYAPMPCRTTAGRCTASGVLSASARIDAPGGDGRVDSVTVSYLGLKALDGSGVYQVWLINPAAGTAPVRATGFVRAVQVDTITDVPVLNTRTTLLTDTTAATSTFVGYPTPRAAHVTFRFRVTNASAGVSLRDYTHVLVTLEPNGPATSPSARRPLVAQFADQRGTPTNYRDDAYFVAPTVRFGNVDLAAGPTYTFAAAGRGLGGFRGDELSVDIDDLSRAPVGYYYQGWLVDVNGGPTERDTVYLPIDTLRGPHPSRSLLFDADSALVDPVVQDAPRVIRRSNIRNFVAAVGLDAGRLCDTSDPSRGVCPWAAYENFIVTIEPKGSDLRSPSPAVLFTAPVPTVVKTGPR